jgi:hypothetical protein
MFVIVRPYARLRTRTGRSSIPKASVMESRTRGVLDTPPEPVIGRAFARPGGGV